MSTRPGPGHPARRHRPEPAFPRAALGVSPTPLHRLTGLMSVFGDGPELLAKREDLCGVAAGGNKIRKLEALLGEALSRRATVVLTTGGVQSNHCAQTAIAAAMHGLRAELYLSGQQPPAPAGNLLIDNLAGAAITFLGEASDRDRDDQIAARMDQLRAQGDVPYLIPLGGSTPLGAAAYAAAVPELTRQLGGQPVTHLVIAAGSLGSMAGLILGTWATRLDCQVHGYTVLWPQPQALTRLQELLEAARRQYFPDLPPRPNYQILGSQLGGGYGAPTLAGREAARLTARHDGLLLDHTYTAKAMAGLIQGIQDGTYTRQDRVVFFHTGGLAGFFATPSHPSPHPPPRHRRHRLLGGSHEPPERPRTRRPPRAAEPPRTNGCWRGPDAAPWAQTSCPRTQISFWLRPPGHRGLRATERHVQRGLAPWRTEAGRAITASSTGLS